MCPKSAIIVTFNSCIICCFAPVAPTRAIRRSFIPRLRSQIEREVTEAMMKSLKYCDLQTESARQPLYQYRAATIHHRLASMYHSCFRNQVNTVREFKTSPVTRTEPPETGCRCHDGIRVDPNARAGRQIMLIKIL